MSDTPNQKIAERIEQHYVHVERDPSMEGASGYQRLARLAQVALERGHTDPPTVIEVHPSADLRLGAESAAILRSGPRQAITLWTPMGIAPLVFTWPVATQMSMSRVDGARSWRVVLDWGTP